jgi:hypothetical protein
VGKNVVSCDRSISILARFLGIATLYQDYLAKLVLCGEIAVWDWCAARFSGMVQFAGVLGNLSPFAPRKWRCFRGAKGDY